MEEVRVKVPPGKICIQDGRCPRGCSLMNPDKLFSGKPAITAKIRLRGLTGTIHLPCLPIPIPPSTYGSIQRKAWTTWKRERRSGERQWPLWIPSMKKSLLRFEDIGMMKSRINSFVKTHIIPAKTFLHGMVYHYAEIWPRHSIRKRFNRQGRSCL